MVEPRPKGPRLDQKERDPAAGRAPEASIQSDDVRGSIPDNEGLDQVRRRIEALVAIAGEHDATMRIEDVMQLLPFRAFETVDAMERFLREDPALVARVSLADGLVVERGRLDLLASHAAFGAMISGRTAAASAFVDRLAAMCPWLLVAGISGSTVYGHAKPEDDLDFFLVVARRRMWITLMAAFLLARIDRKRLGSPVYCFNRTVEDYECFRDFNDQQEPLVAREALTMLVLRGEAHYASILETSDWMASYFPQLYETRRTMKTPRSDEEPLRRGRIHWGLLNGLAFLVVGGYLAMMGFVRNALLAREGRKQAQFRTVIRKGFCAYESNKYDGLRDTYRKVMQ